MEILNDQQRQRKEGRNMFNPYSLAGKTILVTGASSGIGRATAIVCSRLGAKVFITGRKEGRLRETASLLEGEGHSILVEDLSNGDGVRSLADRVGGLDGLVNNAGITDVLPVEFVTEDKLDHLLAVNTKAPILLTTELMKGRKLKKGASIVFTSSIAGNIIAFPANSMYAASKAALSGYVKAAALELARRRIRVNAVCPGMIQTNIMGDAITEEQLQEDAKKYPLKRYGKPEEVAYAIAYLLSDAASFVTGTNLVIDGGYSIQ